MKVELLDIGKPEHAAFMYDLGMACKEDFLNDSQPDMIYIIHEYEQAIKNGSTVAFLCLKDSEKMGIIWVERDIYDVGRIRAGLMPEHRKGFTAIKVLRLFVDYCFETLKLRKLDAEIELYSKKNRTSQAAEKILRRFGFRKEGLIKEAYLRDGKPKNTLLLGLTKKQYEGLKNVQKEKQSV